MKVENPFEEHAGAERYARYRPKYHHLPFEKIRTLVGHDFSSALDVACGTGHSTAALAKISKRAVGLDLSEAMLMQARRHLGIEFVQGNAESLPFGDSEFEFLNISMGFHWLEQDKFLGEANRVLKPSGFLSVDNYGFTGKISQNSEMQHLHSEMFQEYLPRASQRPGHPLLEQVRPFGFEHFREITYEHKVKFSADEFTNLIMTWSNYHVLSNERKAAVEMRMREVYAQIFADEALELDFGGKSILYKLQK